MNTLFGIAMALSAAFFAQFGLVIQKKRVNVLEARFCETGIRKPYVADPLWLSAILMNVVLAVICNAIANAEIGIALAVPVFNGGIIFLVIGLVTVCKEKLTKSNIFAVLLLVAGLILTGFGDVSGTPTLSIFRENTVSFAVFMIALIIVALTAFFIQRKIRKIMIMALGILGGCLMTLNLLMGQIIPLAFEALTEKCFLWTGIFIVMIIIFGGIGTIGNIFCNQKAFKHGNAINYLPIVIAVQNILPVVVGVSVLKQSIGRNWCFYPGLILIIAGAAMLSDMQAEA